MKTFTVYRDDGTITGQIVRCSDDQLAANVRGRRVIEGRYDRVCQRVDLSDPEKPRVVDHQPPKPDDEHEWIAQNPAGEDRASQRWRWVKKPEAVRRDADEHRARQLIADLEAADRAMDRLSPTERTALQRFLNP